MRSSSIVCRRASLPSPKAEAGSWPLPTSSTQASASPTLTIWGPAYRRVYDETVLADAVTAKLTTGYTSFYALTIWRLGSRELDDERRRARRLEEGLTTTIASEWPSRFVQVAATITVVVIQAARFRLRRP